MQGHVARLAAVIAALLLGPGSACRGPGSARPAVVPGVAERPAPAPDAPRPPMLAAPNSLRPCCAFGRNLRLSLVGIPLPGLQLHNITSTQGLGEHRYDGGAMSLDGHLRHGFVSLEQNGIVYTCRGGFVDTAHVRDYADWTFFLWSRIARMLAQGGRIELPEEAGSRFVYVVAMDPAFVEEVGALELSVRLSQWLAFKLSIWHETATWYGWSALAAFPELVSAFSPEDLYSNLLGAELAGAILLSGRAGSVSQFNASVDEELPRLLALLGALPEAETDRAMASVDRAVRAEGAWWDSRKRLPAKDLVLRRNMDIDPPIRPWLVPARSRSSGFAAALDAACGPGGEEPIPLESPAVIGGVDTSRLVRLDVLISEEVAKRAPLPESESRWIGQDDLPELVARARAHHLEEQGPDADRP